MMTVDFIFAIHVGFEVLMICFFYLTWLDVLILGVIGYKNSGFHDMTSTVLSKSHVTLIIEIKLFVIWVTYRLC